MIVSARGFKEAARPATTLSRARPPEELLPGEITVLTAIYGSPKKSNGISYLNKRNLGMDEGGRDQAINWLTQRQYVMPYFELLRLTPAGQSWIEDYLARNASPASAGQMARQPSFPEPNFSVC